MSVHRVVALGASNLTRGFHAVVAAARAAWGPDIEILAALGHGRSYGAKSRFGYRTLPGILQSGLWAELESRPAMPTRALITDVGNDILYGFSADQTLSWVDEALRRVRRASDDVIVTGLPLASIRKLSNAKFLTLRTALVPSSRLTLAQGIVAAERVEAGLKTLAEAHGARFVPLEPAWYGFDPIHVRPRLWSVAWRGILGVPPETGSKARMLEGLRLYALPAERRFIFGRERVTPQHGVALRSGGRVWLY